LWKGGWASSLSLPAQDGEFFYPLPFPESQNFMRGFTLHTTDADFTRFLA
jgi:hypothetical protein